MVGAGGGPPVGGAAVFAAEGRGFGVFVDKGRGEGNGRSVGVSVGGKGVLVAVGKIIVGITKK